MSRNSMNNDKNHKTNSSSLSNCWQARDAWWKCLDLYDNCEAKCQKQIEQLNEACSIQLVCTNIEN